LAKFGFQQQQCIQPLLRFVNLKCEDICSKYDLDHKRILLFCND